MPLYAPPLQAEHDSISNNSYIVSLQSETDATFKLFVTTAEPCTAIRHLILRAVHIESATSQAPGRLSLEIASDYETLCLPAFGFHQGSFTFAKELLAMGHGHAIDLWINGQYHGSLCCDQNEELMLLMP